MGKFKQTEIGEIPEGWDRMFFGEMAQLIKDGYKPHSKDDLAYIGLEHINQQILSLNSVGDSSQVESNKFYFESGDILFGKLRPYFRKVYRPSFKGVCSTDIWVVRAKEGIDQGYLYYLMANQEFINLATSGSSGTRMPRADWDHLKNTEWLVPSLNNQCAIAKILSDLDDKIELNHQMNKTLESIAQAIFKRWFVDFEFPGYEKVKFIGRLPEGWNEVALTDIVDVLGGGTPSTTEPSYWGDDLPFFTPKDVYNSCYVIKTEKNITQKGLENCNSQKYTRNTVFITARGTVGKVCMAGCDMAMNQSCYAIRGKGEKGQQYYIYHLIKSLADQLTQNAHGTVFETITTETFKRIQVVPPAQDILNRFNALVEPFYDLILSNMQETKKLVQIRDSLLPRLMSEKIRVRN